MRNLALSVALIVGLFLPIGAIHAQSTEAVTATCKDGTSFTGTKRSGACRGHGGVQSWSTGATSPWRRAVSACTRDQPARRSGPGRRRSGLGQYSQ